jgi:hypothetical protein
MPSSPRTDSPVIPTFPRRLSAATPTLAYIVEQPRQQKSVLKCTTIIAAKASPSNPNYTFFDSSSASSSSPASSKILPGLQQVPSCLSLDNLGYESDGENDWSEGWDVAPNGGNKGQKAKLPDLSVIRDGDFAYYPKAESRWGEEDSDGSLKLARRRIEMRRSEVEKSKGFKGFWKELLKKFGLGGGR